MAALRLIVMTAFIWALSTAAWSQSLIRDTEIEEMLDIFAEPLLRAGGLNPDSVDIYIVGDPSLNAFVTGGQKMFFHTGLILEVEYPGQLKGVMAHEAGHITGGHLARSGDAARSATGTMLVSLGLGLAAMLAGEGQGGAALIASSQQFAALDYLKYTRIMESSADQSGAQLLEMSGQSGKGLVDFFENFRYQEVLSNARRYPYFRSHPLSSDRIEALRVVVESSPYYDVPDSPEHVEMLERAKAKLEGFLNPPQQVFVKYPPEDKSLNARYARSIAYFRTGSLQLAIEEIDTLIAEEPDNPYFHELKGQMLSESGKIQESLPSLRRANELKPNEPLLQLLLAKALTRTGDDVLLQEGIDLMIAALAQEEENSYGWYELAQAYGRQGKKALAEYATAEQHYYRGDYRAAFQFADRARKELEPGTPAWVRAGDIIAFARTEVEGQSSRNPRRELFINTPPL